MFNVFVLQDFCWCIVGNKMVLVYDIGMFIDCQCFMDVMVGDQYVEFVIVQMFDNVFDVDNGNWVNVGKGFIQQDKFGISG